jgi:hypothetical protein
MGKKQSGVLSLSGLLQNLCDYSIRSAMCIFSTFLPIHVFSWFGFWQLVHTDINLRGQNNLLMRNVLNMVNKEQIVHGQELLYGDSYMGEYYCEITVTDLSNVCHGASFEMCVRSISDSK